MRMQPLTLLALAIVLAAPLAARAQKSAQVPTSPPPRLDQSGALHHPLVLVDQVGYDTRAPKQALVQGADGDHFTTFRVVNVATGKTVLKGATEPAGSVDHWHHWHYWTIDFSAVQAPGRYRVDAQGDTTVSSFPFRVADNVLERYTLSNVVYYFKGQRASGAFARADSHLKKPAGRKGHVDLHGGWYDATGDYGIHLSQLSFGSFFNTQQVPLVAWSLIATRRNLEARGNANFTQYDRRLLDEALFGADFLVRDHVPGGSFYLGIAAPGVGKKAADRVIQTEMENFRIKTRPDESSSAPDTKPARTAARWQASFRSGGGMAIAALAAASALPDHGQFTSAQYLKAAEDAYRFLAAHNASLLNDGTPNIIDDYCALMAATELYRATRDNAWRQEADRRAKRLMSRLVRHGRHHGYWRADNGSRPFYNPSDAGLPVVALANYAQVATPTHRDEARETMHASLAFELRATQAVNNPFGYARQLVQVDAGKPHATFFFPHDTRVAPWWQGEDARIASLAAAARASAPLFADQPDFRRQLEAYAWHQLHWVLGRNPYDTSMLVGSGHLNAQYMFFASWQYTSAPGAIVNGITAAADNPDGIAFNQGYAVTGKDEDWRWTEQWLPHDAWYLYAISLPHS